MFLGYLDQPEATRDKFRGDWMLTGDRAVLDDDGYVHFVGRDDDIIISAGYRIGPSEIEDCLAAHPAVHLAAAVGKPDPLRTEIVKAYVALRPDQAPSEALAREIKGFVRERLSAAEYPREIEFVDDVPLTTSGKVIRRGFREQAAREAGAARRTASTEAQARRVRRRRAAARASSSARKAASPALWRRLPPGGPTTSVPTDMRSGQSEAAKRSPAGLHELIIATSASANRLAGRPSSNWAPGEKRAKSVS